MYNIYQSNYLKDKKEEEERMKLREKQIVKKRHDKIDNLVHSYDKKIKNFMQEVSILINIIIVNS